MSTAKGAGVRRTLGRSERREAILDAAERVFGEKGAAQATMEDVADAAQVSKGTVYLYFKSKDDLFVALTHRPLDAVLARFEALLAEQSLDGLTLLRRLLGAHAEVMRANAANFRLAMSSMCGGFDPDPAAPSLHVYTERVRTLRATYLQALDRGMKDGSIRSDLRSEDVAAALWASMFGATFLRMNASHLQARLPNDERPDFERIVPTLTDLLLDSLRTRALSENPT